VPHVVRRPLVRRSLVLALACVGLIAAGCGDDADSRSETAGMPTTIEDLQSERWVLDGEASTPTIASAGSVTIDFDEDEVHGTGPCNVYGGPFELDDESISFGPLVSTMMACGDDIDAAETDYLRGLEAVETAEIDDDDRLVLTGPDVSFVFDALDIDETLAGTWTILSVATGDAITSVIEGSEPVLTLSDDGEMSVSTGCNDGAGSWERDGDTISFGEIASTMMACEEELSAQQAAIFAALEGAETFEVSPEQLTLLDADGNMVLVASADAE
jgi:heat shock protein HslJ